MQLYKGDIKYIVKALVSFILASLSTMAYIFFTRLNIVYPPVEHSSLMSFTVFDTVVLCFASAIYYRFILHHKKLDLFIAVFSVVLGISQIMLGDIYKDGGAVFYSKFIAHPLLYIASIIGFGSAIYIALCTLISSVRLHIFSSTLNMRLNPFIIASAIFVVWIIGYFAFIFPGAMRWESGLVIGFIEGSFQARKVAPAFYQLFIQLFYYFGKLCNNDTIGLVMYFMCVGFISALAQALIISRLLRLNISRYIVYIAIALCVFNPLVFMQTFIMSYDSLLAISMLYFAICIYDCIYQRFSLANSIRLFCASFAICAFRNVGLALLVAFILVSAFYFIKHYRSRGALYILASVLAGAMFFISNNILYKAMGIERREALGSHSIMLYQLGYTLNKHGSGVLNDSEVQKLSPYVDIDSIGNNYYQNVADSVKYQFLYHDNPYEKSVKDGCEQSVASVWASLGKRYPMDYLSAFVKSCYKFIIPGFFEETNDWGSWQHAPLSLNGINLIKSYKPYIKDTACAEANTLFLGYTTIYGAFMSSGYIFMFLLLALGLLIRSRCNVLPMFIAILYAIGMLFSPVNGWLRYAVPAGFIVPMCILLLLRAYGGKNFD